MNSFLFFLLAFSSISAWSQTAYVPAARLLKAKGQEVFVGADYFKSSKYANRERSFSLKNGEKFQRMQAEVGGRYGVAENFQLGLGARFRQNTSTLVDGTDAKLNASSSGLQSIFTTIGIGLDPVGRMQYTFEGLFRYVPYSNTEITNVATADFEKDLVLGDVGSEYAGGLAATYSSLSNNFFTVRGGWRKPGDYLSSEIYWQAEAASVWKSFALLAGVDGVTSLKNDPDDKPIFNTGRTALYHASNREWITPYVGMNFSLGENWRTELKAAHVVQGKSTDYGTAFGIQLIRRSEASSNKAADAKFKSYDAEVTITKVSPKKGYVVIDKGLAEDITKGMTLDFYEFDYVGGNVLVARGVVLQAKVDSSVVKITKHYNLKKEIKVGLVGRGQLK